MVEIALIFLKKCQVVHNILYKHSEFNSALKQREQLGVICSLLCYDFIGPACLRPNWALCGP